MVNIGASFGPIVMGKLRVISWNTAFVAGAVAIGLMLLITLLFYKEPERKIEGLTLGKKFKDILIAFSDWKFAVFIILLGLFFWLPFWAFFNLCALYVDSSINTAQLYLNLKAIFGAGLANFLSHDVDGVRKVLGETISHTGYIIMIFQFLVSRVVERFKAIPAFLSGLFLAAVGLVILGYAHVSAPAFIFLGIFFFAVGEMVSSPRISGVRPRFSSSLHLSRHFLLRCRRDGLLAPDTRIHHLDCPQGKSRPLHGA